MVTFSLYEENENVAIYRYFPEQEPNDTCADYGILTLSKSSGQIEVTQLAKADGQFIVAAEEQMEIRDSTNQILQEEGMEPVLDDEWPIPSQEFTVYIYAGHAMRRIIDDYQKGKLLEKGAVYWY